MVSASCARLLGAGVVLALLAACQPSMDEVIAYHRDAVQAVFAKLHALEDRARDAPPVTEDKLELGGARVTLDGDDSNALFLLASDLAAPDHATKDANGATRASTVVECGAALRGEFSGVPGGAEIFLKECGRAEYAFVLRARVDEPAAMVDATTFQPGKFEGDVLLYRLSDGANLGGFAVSAASSDQVMAATDENGAPVDAVDRINSDLSAEVFADIEAKLKQLAPGATQ